MIPVEVFYINQLVLSLKSGSSISVAQKQFEEKFTDELEQLDNLKQKNKEPVFFLELEGILERGKQGYPVIKPLLNLRDRSNEKILLRMETYLKSAPFLSLIPLFLFYFPALILVSLGPIIRSFMGNIR